MTMWRQYKTIVIAPTTTFPWHPQSPAKASSARQTDRRTTCARIVSAIKGTLTVTHRIHGFTNKTWSYFIMARNNEMACFLHTGWTQVLWYAGIAVPQVLQYLREFDAPAMQSCKPLPCGIGSCQNRRLREQTLNRKPCHCGSIKGGWCMELPTSLDQPLQGQIVCACLDMFLPVWDLYLFPERVSLVTCKSQRYFKSFC